ncbi:hypothetical protein [Mediterraneibacter gnavus]|uniref:hypothetical protein n=1 Tax=Mediterraneibacter gnavus TaxID=33038 RepID=UPI00156F440F|nr:hypothetical protein [Mediterraneibacter gnavus]
MGFIVMVLSAIIGILLVVMGGIHIKNKQGRLMNTVTLLIGIVLVFFAIWLGFPK